MIKATWKKRGSFMKVFFHVTVLAESSLACLIFCRWFLFLHQLKSEIVVTATLCKVEDWDGKMRQSLPNKLPFLLCFIFKKYRFVKTALATLKVFKAYFEGAVKALLVVLCEMLRHYLIVQLATLALGETWCLFCYLEFSSRSCCLPFSFKL